MNSLQVAGIIFLTVQLSIIEVTQGSSLATGKRGCKAKKLSTKMHKSCIQCTQGYVMDCSNANLTSVPSRFPRPGSGLKPPMCILDLRENNIQTITSKAFINATSIRCLYLSNNNISLLEDGAFIGLGNLTYLNISQNMLEWSDDKHASISHAVLEPLKELRILVLRHNPITSYNGLDLELLYLKSLQSLYIHGCKNCKFGENINLLRQLKNLIFSGNSKVSCNMSVLSNDTFENFIGINLTTLFLSSCHINKIDTLTFKPFNESLVRLDISYNEGLTFTGMHIALGGLVHSTKLNELNVNRIHHQYERGTILECKDIMNLHTLRNLTHLYMDYNKLEVFAVGVLFPYMLPTSLYKMSLAGNRLTAGMYALFLNNVIGLKELDISRQHSNYDPFINQRTYQEPTAVDMPKACTCSRSHSKTSCLRLILPPNITHINWRESFLNFEVPWTLVCHGEHLQTIDFSLNLITVLEGPVEGVPAVTHLDISNNQCKNISAKYLGGFKSLKHLNLSFNWLGAALASPHGRYAFKDVKTLETLDLSNNKITTLTNDIFLSLDNLKYLNLSSNGFDTLAIDLWNSNCLKVLDLSYNGLESLPEYLERYLDDLTRKACNKGTEITLVMSHNPVRCSCDTVPFLHWALRSAVGIHFSSDDECRLKHGKRYRLSFGAAEIRQLVNELEKSCVDYGWLIATCTSVLGCVITTVITLIVYRKRWKLRHLYYSRKRRHIHKDYQRLFTYDAFISYSKESAKFIRDKMVPALEHERGLKLWVTDRDSHPGASVAENIVHALYNSKKSIHLLDDDSLRDSWCDYEINMANMEAVETKRSFIIIVEMGARSTDIPLTTMRLLDSEESLKYPVGGNIEEIYAFWTRLAEIVMTE